MRRKEFFQNHSMRSALPWHQNQISTQEIKLQTNVLDKHRCRIISKINIKPNSTAHWKDYLPWSNEIHPRYARMVQPTWINELINMIQHTNRMKDKKSYDYPNRCRKGIWWNLTSLHPKTFEQIRYRRNVPQNNTSHL